jgi:hypothetical protein
MVGADSTPTPEASATVIGDGPLARAMRGQLHAHPSRPMIETFRVIDLDDDVATLTALDAHFPPRDGTAGTIVARVEDKALRRAVQERAEADGTAEGLILIAAADLEAERFTARTRLYEMAHWRGQACVHVAIFGFGASGQAFLDALAMAGIAGTLGRPLFHIIVDDATAARDWIDREMPEIGASADIIVLEAVAGSAPAPADHPLAIAERVAPLTAILVLAESAAATIANCLTVSTLQDRHALATAAVFIGGPARRIAYERVMPRRSGRDLGWMIGPIDEIDAIEDLMGYLSERRDRSARRLHEAYVAEFGAAAISRTWEGLAETYRRTNRRAAAHLPQKLWSIGLDVGDGAALDPGGIDPATMENVVRPAIESTIEEATIRQLARLEHERWCTDRRLDGWRYGHRRDDLGRLHPSLVSFDDPRLSAAEISKDVSQVRFLLKSLVREEVGGAAAGFVAGVVSANAETSSGIMHAALAHVLIEQPRRFATLVSPLMTLAEVEGVTALIEAMTASGQRFRLIVPTFGRDHSQYAAPDVVGRPALAMLLNAATCWRAPIGAIAVLDDPDWLDPTAAMPIYPLLARYLAERCHAISVV